MRTERSERLRYRVFGAGLLSGLLLSLLLPGQALAEKIDPSSIPLSAPFSRSLQKYTGLTPFSGWLGERILEHALAKELDGQIQVRLRPYSATDLFGGKAESLSVHGRNLVYDDFVPITELRVETDEKYPLYIYKGSKPMLLQPLELQLNAVVSEDDVNRMLQSEKGQKLLSEIKVPLPPFDAEQRLDLLEPKVNFEGERFHLETRVNIHGSPVENALPVALSAKLKPSEKVLLMEDVDLSLEGVEHAEAVEAFVEQYFGELFDDIVKVKISRHKTRLTFEQSDVKDGKLYLQARMRVEPDPKALARLNLSPSASPASLEAAK